MDVGNPGEAGLEALPDLRFALEPAAPGIRAARHLEHAVLGEELHDRVNVVSIEGGEDAFERLNVGRFVGHLTPFGR